MGHSWVREISCTQSSLLSWSRRYNLIFLKIIIGAIVVYDCTDPDTFKKMNQWVSELKQYLPAEIPILIAGNKSDLQKSAQNAIDDQTASSYARGAGSQYFPTSAKSGNNVNEIF